LLRWALFEDLSYLGVKIPITYILECEAHLFYEMIYRYRDSLTSIKLMKWDSASKKEVVDDRNSRKRQNMWLEVVNDGR